MYSQQLTRHGSCLQVGTGVMVGLPGQTLRDLAGDIMFFRDLGADMIGMVCSKWFCCSATMGNSFLGMGSAERGRDC
jgi:hypothetical protein